jgi:hypothetical protein
MARDPNVVIIESPRTEYVDRNVTIHEHRAPTDQSVALLKELEQAARDKVEHSINVGGNGFECVVHIHKSAIDMDTVAVAIFKLNGKQMRAEARIEGWRLKDAQELPVKIRDAVALKIATEIVGTALVAAQWPRM